MKRLIAKIMILICMVILFTPALPANAEVSQKSRIKTATTYISKMKDMGISIDKVSDIKLDKSMTKLQGVMLLIKLLDKNNEAKETKYFKKLPLDKVSTKSKPYVAYAYFQNWVGGKGKDVAFNEKSILSAEDFTNMVLGVLGYSYGIDFENEHTSKTFKFAEKIKLLKKSQYSSKTKFATADAYIIFYQALNLKMDCKEYTLFDIISGASEETPGSGDSREAGNFRTNNGDLVTINKNADYDTNFGKLNQMLFNTYGLRYIPELSKNGLSGSTAEFVYDESTGRYGLAISAWRKSYDSGIALNNALNAILESFYFFSGDKDVAVSLWKWFDAKNINGYSNTDDFGFKDTATFKNGFTAAKNGVEIDITEVNGVTTVYFH